MLGIVRWVRMLSSRTMALLLRSSWVKQITRKTLVFDSNMNENVADVVVDMDGPAGRDSEPRSKLPL